ncbi:MAG: hypothetical protein JO048_13255 [Methylobacteriaceae bacterium]|nr:hypothetical protein [Methylobacteriaceae bacterium]
MSRRLHSAMLDSAADATEAAVNSAVTVAGRWPILAACLVTPTGAGLAEWHHAYTEKVSAAVEGGLAALAAWQSIVFASLLAPATPLGLAEHAMVVARAGARPAQRRVRLNAERFTLPRSY